MATPQLDPVVRYVRQVAVAHRAPALPDAQLLDRFASDRDEAAFAALVRRHGPLVLGVCRRVLNDWHAADDAFQATFLVLARRAGSLKRREALRPWLYGVATRTALKARAREARRRKAERQAAVPAAAEHPDALVWRDLRPVLDEAVAGLPAKYRVPFVLHHLEGATVAEVGRRLGCPQGTVAARLARAKEQLRTRLARRGVALPAAALAVALSKNTASARVPPALTVATARAATAAAGYRMVAGAGPATIPLTPGGQAMLRTKLKVAVAVLLAMGAAAGGVVLEGRGTPAGVQAVSGGGGPREPAACAGARVPATVNGEPILAEEVYAAAYLTLPNARNLAAPECARRIAAVWKDTLDRVVEREVVLQDAATTIAGRNPAVPRKLQEVSTLEFGRQWAQAAKASAGVKDDDELNASLRRQGTSLEAVRRQWERDFLAAEYLRYRVSRVRGPGGTPSEEAARQQRECFIAHLKQQAVIEYAGGQ
jgi:RNA polymerase sigma factor (sigma-70 family)